MSMSPVSAIPGDSSQMELGTDNLAVDATGFTQNNDTYNSLENNQSSKSNSEKQTIPDPQIYKGGVPVARGGHPAGYQYSSIADAINDALNGDTIMLENGATFYEHLIINKNLTFNVFNNGHATIDGSNNGRVIYVTSGVTVYFYNIIITHGKTPGGPGPNNLDGAGIYNEGTVYLINCTLTGNNAGNGADGGASDNGDNGGNGGAVYNTGTLNISNSTLTSNTAGNGGNGGKGNGDPAIEADNVNGGDGGNGGHGGSIYNTGTLILTNCTLNSNYTGSGADGGTGNEGAYGIDEASGGDGGNGGYGGNGGAIYTSGTSTLTNCDLISNYARYGGEGGNAGDGKWSVVEGGDGGNGGDGGDGGSGGAIYNIGTLTLNGCDLNGNTAGNAANGGEGGDGGKAIDRGNGGNGGDGGSGGAGGAVYNDGQGNFKIIGCTITDNHTGSGGSGGSGGTGGPNGHHGSNGGVGIGGAIGSKSSSSSNFLNFNRITGNSQYEVQAYNGQLDATLNWWGSNGNPSGNVAGTTVSYDPWIILTITPPSNTHVPYGGSQPVTADFRYDSNNNFHDPAQGHIPDGMSITFAASWGSLTPSSNTLNGVATATYQANGASSPPAQVQVFAQIDSQTSKVGLIIDNRVIASPSGGTYKTAQKVTLTSDDPDNSIYYTNDTTDPRTSPTRITYTGPITISNTTTLRYAAITSSGNWSALYLQNYVIGSGGLAYSAWPKYGNDITNTGQSTHNGPQTNNVRWIYTAGGALNSAIIGTDGTIYIGSDDTKLYAINPDGTLKWIYATGNAISGSAAIGADGTIYIGSSDYKLYAINPNGTLKWSYKTGDQIWGSPAIGADGTIYISCIYDKIYALNPDGTLKWSYSTGDLIYSFGGPAIGYDGTIYVGSTYGNLYAINPDGTLSWSYAAAGEYEFGSPTIGADGTIYVAGNAQDNITGRFYALNPDGTLKWSYDTDEWINGCSPVIGADGTIYIGSQDGKLYALNPDGTLKWAYTTGYYIVGSPVIGSDGIIYFGCSDKKIYAVNPDGTLKWSYATGNQVQFSPAIGADGTLYIGSGNKLYAFRDPSTDDDPTEKTRETNENEINASKVTVEMKETGLPVNFIILALLMILGGSLMPRRR